MSLANFSRGWDDDQNRFQGLGKGFNENILIRGWVTAAHLYVRDGVGREHN